MIEDELFSFLIKYIFFKNKNCNMNFSTLSLPVVKKLTRKSAIKICTVFFITCVLMLSGLYGVAQATYNWAAAGSASWANSASWTPARITPAANDILIFSTGGTVTATAIPTQTIGQLSVSGNTIVNLQSAAAATTLSISGGTGTDLSLASGSQLNISGSTVLIISVLTGATGSITGNMTFSSSVASTVNQLVAADASGITFNSGAIFTQSTNSTGNVFGSGTANSIVFASGSTFNQSAGSNPFQKTAPASVVVFQTGSLYKANQSGGGGLSISGRTYANLEFNGTGTNTMTGTGALSIDNLTINAGTNSMNLTVGGISIKGNISVAASSTLAFSPTAANTLTFNGSTAQTITNAGTLTFGANEAVVIANTGSPTASVTFNQLQTISGSMTVNSGSILAIGGGTLTLSGTPAINGSFQINPSGFASGGTWSYGASGTLIYNTSSNFGENGGAYWPTLNGPVNVTVQNTGGITMNVARAVSGVFQTSAGVTTANNLTLNGTGKINTGGFFAAIPVWGASSTLIYNTGTTFGRGNEFPNAGNVPSNVQVSNNTTINYPNAGLAARTLTGNLTIDAGSSFYMDFGSPNPGVGILTINNLVLNGNLSLGSQSGGDLVVKGNFTRTGTFAPVGRAVFLNAASGNQTITGATTFDYLIVDKAAGSVVLANDITVNQIITLTNGTVNTAANKVILASNATGALTRTNGYVNGNLQRAINTGANTYNFAVGTSLGYTPASLAFTAVGGAGNITMSSADAVGANYPAILNATKRLARSWSSTNSAVTGITGSATFTYLPADLLGGAVSGNLKAYVYNGTTTYTTNNTNTSNSFTYNGLTTVGEFGAGECGTSLAPTFTKTMVSACGGGADGTITVTPVGGVAPYTYNWTSTPGGFSGNTAVVTGLTPRDYTVVTTDAIGCTKSIPDITIFQVFATVVTNNGGGSGSCANTGYILLYGSGGVQPYTYSINGINYFVSNSFTALAAGTYTGYVKDFGGCVSTKPGIVVIGAAPIVVTANTRPATSCANNGTIELYRTGGMPPFTYSLNDVTYQGGNTFNNLAGATTYTGWVKDAAGCKTSLTGIFVAKAAAITVASTVNNTSACSNTGRIQVLAGGGVPGYTYSITGANGTYQASNAFTGMVAGSYNVWVQDSKGCKNVQFSVVVGTNAAPTITVTAYPRSASSCANNGSIELYRTGGVSPFTYSLDNITYQASNTFTGLAGGTFTGWVKDANGCTGSLAGITITQGAAVTVTEQHTNASCVNDGTIQLTPGGGVPGYMYSLNNITYQPGNSFSGLAAGNFTGWVKDTKGCTASVPVTIGTNAAIVVTSFVVNASSCESNNGSIQLFRTGGTGPFTYSLNNVTYQAGNVFSSLLPGSYTGYVKDSKGCVGSLTNILVGPNCAPPAPGIFTKSNAVKVTGNAILKATVYPNPSAAEFTLIVTGNNKEKVSFFVTDIMGRNVYRQMANADQQVRFGNNLKPGIYTVQVIQGNQKQHIKLIKE